MEYNVLRLNRRSCFTSLQAQDLSFLSGFFALDGVPMCGLHCDLEMLRCNTILYKQPIRKRLFKSSNTSYNLIHYQNWRQTTLEGKTTKSRHKTFIVRNCNTAEL